MLPLEEIKTAIVREANGMPITRYNYTALADRVVPACDFVLNAARAFPELPEWAVYHEASALRSSDWLDLACVHASLNQVKRAAEQFCQSHAPGHNSMTWQTAADERTGWWNCTVCGYRYGS